MAHKKAGSTAKTNKDSISKRLGVKKFGGEKVISGNIIIRQKGNKFYAGAGAAQGNDFTIYSLKEGVVKFITRRGKKLVSID